MGCSLKLDLFMEIMRTFWRELTYRVRELAYSSPKYSETLNMFSSSAVGIRHLLLSIDYEMRLQSVSDGTHNISIAH